MNYLVLVDIKENHSLPKGYDKYFLASKSYVWAIKECNEAQLDFEILQWQWTDDNINKEYHYILEQKDRLLKSMYKKLNDYHDVLYSMEAWDIAIGQWLLEYIASFHDKFIALTRLNELGVDLCCDIYPDLNCEIPLDYEDFERLIYDDEFNLYQYSLLYWVFRKKFKNIHVHEVIEYKKKGLVFSKKTRGYWKAKIYDGVVSLAKAIIHSHDEVSVHNAYFPNGFIFLVMVQSKFKISNYIVDYSRTIRPGLKIKTDDIFRRVENKNVNSFEDFLIEFVWRLLPMSQVENFDYLHRKMLRIFPRGMDVKAAFFTAEGFTYNEITKLYLMDLKQKHMTLCGVQHGGNYGIDIYPYMANEYSMCDRYYTWGWDGGEKYECIFKPMPATKLMSNLYKSNVQGTDILYISYSYNKYIHHMVKRIVDYPNYVNEERKFISELDDRVKKNLRVRLFSGEEQWGIKKNLLQDNPYLVIDPIKDFCESLSKAKMVVISGWSTTFSEAIHMDKPAIVYRPITLMEEWSIEDLKSLHEVGILATNWAELKGFVNIACKDIDTWWRNEKRKRVVSELKKKYIKMDNNAEDIWRRELLSYY